MADFNEAISSILLHEGGYVNHPKDPGGATNFGVSLRYLRGLSIAEADINNDGEIDELDIKSLTKEEASKIYKKYWWDKYAYHKIRDQKIATKIFDMAVNMGAVQAHKLAQRACNAVYSGDILKVDGLLGPKTLILLNELNALRVLYALRSQMAGFYKILVQQQPQLVPFLKGWLSRAAQ